MATELTTLAANKAAGQNQIPQLVLDIHGYSYLISLGAVTKYIRIGDEGLLIGDEWFIGGLNQLLNNLDIINLKSSSKTLSQQIIPDKGQTASVPSFSLSLIDIDLAMTELVSPSVVLADILGVRADLYVGYKDTAYPQDFVRIISGTIDRTELGSGITLNISHPEGKKRTEIFQKATTKTTSAARFRSLDIQGLTYITRRDVVTSVTVTYIGGGLSGNEVVTVAGSNITVQIQAGVSTANSVRTAIENKIEALTLVEVSIVKNLGGTTQAVMGTTTLTTATTIDVVSTSGFLLPVAASGLRTYVRIDDEVIEYTGVTSTSFTGCTREALVDADQRAEGTHHDTDTSVDSFYRLQGTALDLALKLLLSDGGVTRIDAVDIKHIGNVEEVTTPNTLYFDGADVITKYGIVLGDFVTVTLDPTAANNVIDAVVSDVVTTTYGSYIVLGGYSLVESLNTPAVASFKSKYNVLPYAAGVGLTGEEVDVPRYEDIAQKYASSIFTYDFYLKDTLTAADFIDTKILFSTGAYPIPRLGKVSVAKNVPPLGTANLVRLDEHNTQSPETLKITRSFNKYFYNTVVFKYNEAVVDERMLSGEVDIDTISRNRIRVGAKSLVIDCGGIRPTVDNIEVIAVLREQFRNKYRFGAEVINVQTFYGDTFSSDVGDVVIFGDGLNLVDTKSGTRNFKPRLWDVLNKSLTIETGNVQLTLMDSAYSLDNARFGVVSPSSLCSTGSTTTELKMKNSYDIEAPRTENQKWRGLNGLKLIVHSEDWAVSGTTYLKQISTNDNFTLIVEPALAFAPLDNYVIDLAPYNTDGNPEDNPLGKGIYVFTNPTVAVTSGVSTTSFNVNILEAPLFLVDHVLIIHNDDYTILSPEVKVVSTVGTLVTVSATLGFIPAAGQEVELIGYTDGGAPYRYF